MGRSPHINHTAMHPSEPRSPRDAFNMKKGKMNNRLICVLSGLLFNSDPGIYCFHIAGIAQQRIKVHFGDFRRVVQQC